MLLACATVAVVSILRLTGALDTAPAASPAVRRAALRGVDIIRRGVLGRAPQLTSDLRLLDPCDVLTTGARQRLVDALKGFDHGRIASCDAAFGYIGGELVSASVKREYRTATVAAVTSRGDSATVRFHGGLGDFGLRRVGGRWLVDRYPV